MYLWGIRQKKTEGDIMGQGFEFTDSSGNIYYHCVELDAGVHGFVYHSRKGKYHIFVSNSLSSEAIMGTFMHELHHIKKDLAVIPYIIGVDNQREPMELSAEDFARVELRRLLG